LPRAVEAQPAGKVNPIGWLSPASAPDGMPNLYALRNGLREVGYVEGRNITIEARWADGKTDRLPPSRRTWSGSAWGVICTADSQATMAAKQATKEIPVVFANIAFPLEQQLVASYGRPGGNLTLVAFIGPEYGRRLELLREASPKLTRVALLYNPENTGSVLALKETQRWAVALGLTLGRPVPRCL
jgi:putative tryptophan/tyrosine transport system substrate-binding protein